MLTQTLITIVRDQEALVFRILWNLKDKDKSGCPEWGRYYLQAHCCSHNSNYPKKSVPEGIFMGFLILCVKPAISYQTAFIHKDCDEIKLWQVPFGWSWLQFCSFPPSLKFHWRTLYSHFPACFKQKAAAHPSQLLWLTQLMAPAAGQCTD